MKVCVEKVRKLKRWIQLLSQYNQKVYTRNTAKKLWKNLHPSQGLSFASINQVQDQDSSIREYVVVSLTLLHTRYAQFLCFFSCKSFIIKFYSNHIWMFILYLFYQESFTQFLCLWDFSLFQAIGLRKSKANIFQCILDYSLFSF